MEVVNSEKELLVGASCIQPTVLNPPRTTRYHAIVPYQQQDRKILNRGHAAVGAGCKFHDVTSFGCNLTLSVEGWGSDLRKQVTCYSADAAPQATYSTAAAGSGAGDQ